MRGGNAGREKRIDKTKETRNRKVCSGNLSEDSEAEMVSYGCCNKFSISKTHKFTASQCLIYTYLHTERKSLELCRFIALNFNLIIRYLILAVRK